MNVDEAKTLSEFSKAMTFSATNNTGCSKCLGAGVLYYQWCRGNGGWTQMWAKCDSCDGKGHASN